MSAGWLLYDGDCRLCCDLAARFRGALGRRGFDLVPLQTPWVMARLGLAPGAAPDEMKLLTADGVVFGGASAVLFVARRVWWGWPLYLVAQLPGAKSLLSAAYRWLAARRHCAGGACAAPRASGWHDWSPLAVLPSLALALRPALPAWAFMSALALAIYAGCKWLTWRRALKALGGGGAGAGRSLGYLLAWPGMDARAFLSAEARAPKPAPGEWAEAIFKIFSGGVLLWCVARLVPPQLPVLAGWVGLVGMALLLHFGIFHLAALCWQRLGVRARPIMNRPARATSLSDFWGSRWNMGFHQLAHAFVFRPLRGRLGAGGATVATFLVSGLVHDLAISLPAAGGYGLPTAYFTLQGFGVLLERSRAGRRLGLARAPVGRLFALLFTAGPVYWLFHPHFVTRVVIPLMHVTAAL